jgi:hypothetical protein
MYVYIKPPAIKMSKIVPVLNWLFKQYAMKKHGGVEV